MIATFLKLVPFRDYVYAAAAIAAIVFYNVHVHNLEVRYAAKQMAAVTTAVKTSSDKLIAAAAIEKAKDAQAYAANLKQVNETYAKQTTADAATHAADLQRLRQLAAVGNSGGSGSLEGASGAGSPADPGRSSLIGLGYVSAELAAALHDARDDLGLCYAERDSLTGK